MAFSISQILFLFCFALSFFSLINKYDLRKISSTLTLLFSIFITLQVLSLILIKELFNYLFFINIVFDSLLTYIHQFYFHIILALILIIANYYLLNNLVRKIVKAYSSRILLILIFLSFALLNLNNGVIQNLQTIIVSIEKPKTKNIDEALGEINFQNKPKDYLNSTYGKNILVLSLESLENGFIKETKSLTPFLNSFINENFYYKMEQVAGFTAGSLYTLLTGIPPYFFRNSGNSQLQGIKSTQLINLGDILKNAGYELKYLMSNPEFAGTDDLLNASHFKIISEKNNDGMFTTPNDKELFKEIKKQMVQSEKPFAIFASTINTHFPDGIYDPSVLKIIDKSKDDFSSKLEISIYSLDFFIKDLFKYIDDNNLKQNLSVFIIPDHKMMGNNSLVNSFKERGLYLITNENLNFEKNYINQLELPKIILKGAGVKTNASFIDVESILKADFKTIANINYHNLNKKKPNRIIVGTDNDILTIRIDNKLIEHKINAATKFVSFLFDSEFNLIKSKNEIFQYSPNKNRNSELSRPIELVIKLDKTKINNCFFYNNANLYEDLKCSSDKLEINNKTIERIYRSNNTNFIFYHLSKIYTSIHFFIKSRFENLDYLDDLDSSFNVRTILGDFKHDNKRFIAHAGGEINGDTYTNSLEALQESYTKGLRLFELDIIKTTDGKYVAAHDWLTWKNQVDYEEKNDSPVSLSEFLKYKILNKYTPMDMNSINKWFEKHTDAYLVTDKVNEPFDFSEKFIDKDRLMMELFSIDAVKEAQEANIYQAMPNGSLWRKLRKAKYRKSLNFEDIEYFVVARTIKEKYLNEILAAGKKTFMFGLDRKLGIDEQYFLCNSENYHYGVYIDKTNLEEINCNVP
jgi:hypothetical protein